MVHSRCPIPILICVRFDNLLYIPLESLSESEAE